MSNETSKEAKNWRSVVFKLYLSFLVLLTLGGVGGFGTIATWVIHDSVAYQRLQPPLRSAWERSMGFLEGPFTEVEVVALEQIGTYIRKPASKSDSAEYNGKSAPEYIEFLERFWKEPTYQEISMAISTYGKKQGIQFWGGWDFHNRPWQSLGLGVLFFVPSILLMTLKKWILWLAK